MRESFEKERAILARCSWNSPPTFLDGIGQVGAMFLNIFFKSPKASVFIGSFYLFLNMDGWVHWAPDVFVWDSGNATWPENVGFICTFHGIVFWVVPVVWLMKTCVWAWSSFKLVATLRCTQMIGSMFTSIQFGKPPFLVTREMNSCTRGTFLCSDADLRFLDIFLS